MPELLLRRVARSIAVIAFAAVASFLLLRFSPGDAASTGSDAAMSTEASRAAARARMGLDQPIGVQAATHFSRVLRGELGTSSSEQRPVREVIGDALPATILLCGCALLLAAFIGIAVGTIQGWYTRSRVATALGSLLLTMYALPEVVLGIALLALLGVHWRLFPVGGIANPIVSLTATMPARIADRLWHLVLPATVLALAWCGGIVRYQRSAVRDIGGELFVRTALAKGLSQGVVLRRHVLRPALSGTVALLGTMLPTIVGGTVIVESLFSWPGMGTLMVRAVAERDAPLVAGATLLIATIIALASLATELIVLALDPRTRVSART